MSEAITTYLLSDPETPVPMDRDEFYGEQQKIFEETGKPTRAAGVVHLLIVNSDGDLLLQKRSHEKDHNPGLIDKSIGGHIKSGITPDFNVMVETVQELQTPSIVLKDDEDFLAAKKLLGGYLETIGVVERLKTEIFNSRQIFQGKERIIANKAFFYLGVYDGRTRPVDKEARGILFYTLKELEAEIKENPQIFTYDLIHYIGEFRPQISKFMELVRNG